MAAIVYKRAHAGMNGRTGVRVIHGGVGFRTNLSLVCAEQADRASEQVELTPRDNPPKT